MTRDEAVADIRSVGRTCRGPSVFTEEERAQYTQEGNAALYPFNIMAANRLRYKLEKNLSQGNTNITDPQVMAQRLVALIYARTDIMGNPCGYDYNNFVISNPWDGKQYVTKCPQCGTEDRYQAPVYQIEE